MNERQLKFEKAARNYDRYSALQKQMAERLIRLLPPNFKPKNILELGCGTGHLSEKLIGVHPSSRFLFTDTSRSMLDICRIKIAPLTNPDFSRWEILDAEGKTRIPPDSRESFDLVAANAVIQWFPNFGVHLDWIAHRLRPGGFYLVSDFSGSNFPELRELLEAEPFGYRNFPGHESEDVKVQAREKGFETVRVEADRIALTYSDAREFFLTIKKLGASLSAQGQRREPMTRSRLMALEREYSLRHSLPEGVVATWKPWYALLRKDPGIKIP